MKLGYAMTFATVLAAPAATVLPAHAAAGPDLICMTRHCPLAAAGAIFDKEFMSLVQCENKCSDMYPTDPTPEKLHYQNCTTTCALTYESPKIQHLIQCAMANNCLNFPPIPGSCPEPAVHPSASLKILEGEWWQHRGKNALWDCYACQHIHSLFLVNDDAWCAQSVDPVTGPVKAPCYNYSYSYDLYTETGTRYFGQSWQLPAVPPGEPIKINYEYMGSLHNETWYIIGFSDTYVLLVDCSYMNSWTNVGSIVWVRPHHELTYAENRKIAEIYKEKLGWNYSEFCYDRHGDTCDGPSASSIPSTYITADNLNLKRTETIPKDIAARAAFVRQVAPMYDELKLALTIS